MGEEQAVGRTGLLDEAVDEIEQRGVIARVRGGCGGGWGRGDDGAQKGDLALDGRQELRYVGGEVGAASRGGELHHGVRSSLRSSSSSSSMQPFCSRSEEHTSELQSLRH